MLKLTMQLAKLTLDSRMQQLGAADQPQAKRPKKVSERSSMEGMKRMPSLPSGIDSPSKTSQKLKETNTIPSRKKTKK